MTSSDPNYLPKAPSPNTIPLGVRPSTYDLGGNRIQSRAVTLSKCISSDSISDLFSLNLRYHLL